ncbi:MAG: ATP-dependent zinc metalloprotease FtsH, partial [Clostridia bacterium]|nr:ATP-dependent zinc metalloprotease FtsH [Clostridia bacterium]
GVAENKFPNSVDYYCSITNNCDVHGVIEEWNNTISERNAEGKRVLKPGYEGKVIIEENYSYETESFISRIMPYLSIAVVIIIGIMLFKSLSSGGKQGFGFAKNKAKLVVSSNVRFTDVAGAEEEKEELKEIVEFLKTPSRFTELGARIPKGVLLVGPPGTGKTLLAKAVAGESKVPFFSISGSDFVELYVGVGASRVRDLFESAKASAPCIVFIDEIDAVGRQRGAGLGGGNDEREQTLNQLLVEMDGFETNSGIIVLAATNRSDVLDPALTRPGRFDRQIYVHLPDVKGREEIIKVHSRNKPLSEDVDFKRLARLTSGLAGADIENMLNEAALLAARDGRYKITMVDIQEGLNKAIMGPKKVSMVVTEEDKKITAVHEAGHAIVAESLPGCDKVQEISVIPRGGAGGYTLTFDEKDRTHMPKQKLLDTLAMMLGGRTAEEVMLNDVTTGASNDIDRATKLAHKMVAEWGMSEKLGLVSVGEGEEVFVGRNYQRSIAYSQQLAYEIDEEVKKLINEAHKTATKILTEKKEVIERIQQILLDKETIYKEEFEMLFNGASVEEVEKAIDKKEKEKKAYQEKAKKQAAEERFIKEIKNRVETAEALAKAGVISAQDLNKIKNEAEAQVAKRTVKKEEPVEEKVETKKATKKTTRKSTS